MSFLKKAFSILITVIIAMCLFSCSNAESIIDLTKGRVTCKSKYVEFSYPSDCLIENDGDSGTIVYLNSAEYVSIAIPRRNLSGIEALREYVMDDEKILSISDTICIFAAHGDNNHHMPNIDIVEIGINLKSGLGIVITSFGSRGQTQIYNLMLTILQSLIDASEIETWLQETWIPYITEF